MDKLFAVQYSYLIPLLPLIGAVISGFFGARLLKGKSHWPIWIGVGISAGLSITMLLGALQISKFGAPEETSPTAHLVAGESRASILYASPSVTRWYDWITAGDTTLENDDVSRATRPAQAAAPAAAQEAPPKLFYAGTKYLFQARAGAWIDPLTCVMLCVVTVIGFFITVFSAGYMKGEDGYFRFMAYMGLFIFAMTILVMADNFLLMYLGWEGVGLCSYLLIGYYYQRPSAREAAKKAFIVNRGGDFSFSLGIMLSFLAFGTVSFFGDGPHTGTGLLEKVAWVSAVDPNHLLILAKQWIPFLLMLGAFGKSAQFPLYVWLPDAMEGPTPVSALIHAATMVTAGVYMIARCSTLFVGNNIALYTVAAVGAFTALFAATIALRQFDLKKVFAYSTISQLGYMFVGVGVLAPVAGIFHLVTHAFFKALLFLASGVVMHAMAGELDMRKMSGIKRVLPWTNVLMLIGCLALAGFPFLSGFFSKDDIIGAAFSANPILGITLLVAAFLTAYYTFRLYFRVFLGPELIPTAPPPAQGSGVHDGGAHDASIHAVASTPAVYLGTPESSGVDVGQTRHAPAHEPDSARGHANSHAHDHGQGSAHHNHEPALMIIPLIVLAIGALLAGYLNWPERAVSLGGFLAQSPSLADGLFYSAHAYGKVADPAAFGQIEPGATGAGIPVMMIVSAILAICGIALAWYFHLANRAAGQRLAERLGPITRLLEAKYWVDEFYQGFIVEPLRTAGKIFFGIDRLLVDGVVWIVGFVPQASGFVLKLTTQRGYLQGYAASMLFGVLVILVIIFI